MSNARFGAVVIDARVARVLARRGEVGAIAEVELAYTAVGPAYEGGLAPAWLRDVAHPFVAAGEPGLALIEDLLGPIADLDARWRSEARDPELAYDDWRATVRCARGTATLHLTCARVPAPPSLVVRGAGGTLTTPPPSRIAALRDRGAHPTPTASATVSRALARVADAARADHARRLAALAGAERVPFLVTGASGNLGKAVVRRLVADGHRVRALVRRVPETAAAGVDYVVGNLGDPEAVDRAVRGAEVVLHVGAATKGGWPEHRVGTVLGTQHVVDACVAHRVRQLVYVSSMSVIDWAGSAGTAAVTEAAALEPRPEERGPYTRAKLEAERLVVAAAARGLPCVILRPGQIFGAGMPLVNGAVARALPRSGGRWLVLGDGTLELPLVYVDDVVDAIVAAAAKQLVGGEVIQIIDPEHLTQRDVLALAGHAKVVAVPRAIVFALGKLSELPLAAIGRRSPVALYRLRSALARLHYESDRAARLLGWVPRVGVREGIRRVTAVA